jgi:hypothetical protein
MVKKELITIGISFVMVLGLASIIAAMIFIMEMNVIEKNPYITDIELINDSIINSQADIAPTL